MLSSLPRPALVSLVILASTLSLSACREEEEPLPVSLVEMGDGPDASPSDMSDPTRMDQGDTEEEMSAEPDLSALDMGADQGPRPFDAAALFESFGTLHTIAGTAKNLDAVNAWMPGFEGGRALDAELSRPHIALADSEGNVFIADKDAHAIRKVSPQGIITTVAGTSAPGDDGDGPRLVTTARLNSPNGLFITSDDTLYIYDLGNDRVVSVGADGMMRTLFEVGGSGAGRGLWVSDDASIAYVSAGSALKVWTPAAGVKTLATGFVSLGNLHVSPSGELGVTDRDGSKVYLIDRSTGEKTHIAGSGSGGEAESGMRAIDAGLDEVRGIWFHPIGGYFLATHKGGQVWYVDEGGMLHLFLHGDKDEDHAGDGERFDTPGKKISEPRAVTMTPQGALLVTEHDGGYIRQVDRR